jgi:hypothetical protein
LPLLLLLLLLLMEGQQAEAPRRLRPPPTHTLRPAASSFVHAFDRLRAKRFAAATPTARAALLPQR